MIDDLPKPLLEGLFNVQNSRQFKDWVSFDLRRYLPHAAFLGTLGRLYGVGSVATHRIAVDFPLNIIEDLKNSSGALDDPTMYGWFKSERLRHVDLANSSHFSKQQRWRQVLLSYGMQEVIVHGAMDHVSRRFAVFQIMNPVDSNRVEMARLFGGLVPHMSRIAWAAIDARVVTQPQQVVGHPTLSLTTTELQIVELLAQGLSNKEIARRRGVSDSTVKTQVQRTGAKLGATRRAEIVALAMHMLSPLPAQTLLDYGDAN